MQKFLAVLRIRPFLFLWLTELFSQIAMNMMNFILILVAFSLTNSNTAVSGIVLSFTVPSIIFGVVAGVYVDRWNKKFVLLWTNLIRFGLLLVLAYLHTQLVFLYGISFGVAIITQFFIPAETPLIPQFVKAENLLAANALFSMAWFGSVFIAYALSGPFLLLFGTTNALIVLAGIFLVAAGSATLIPIKGIVQKKVPHVQMSIFAEIRNAIKVIFSIRDVSHAFFLLVLTQMLTIIISVIGPGYAKHILGININTFPLVFVTPAVVGMAIGSYVVINYLYRFSRHKIATLGLGIGAFVMLLMPYAPHFGGAILGSIILAVFLGVANACMFVPSNTLVQEHTSDQMRGKIYGTLNSASSLLSLIPVILVGSFADIFGSGYVLIALGLIIGIIALFRIAL